MSEVIPVLAYWEREYRRGPLLIALAILAILFGLLSIGVSVFYIVDLRTRLSGGGSLPTSYIVNSAVSYGFSSLRMLMLVGSAIAFLARKKYVAMLLSAYFCVSIFEGVLDPTFRVWAEFTRLGFSGLSVSTLLIVVGIPRVVVDVVLLMLLRTGEVQKIIRDVTGVREQSF